VTAELLALSDSEPDLRLAVSFNTQDTGQSTIELQTVAPGLAAAPPTMDRPHAITIEAAGAQLELSAVQSATTGQSDQISIGAINDGYPLLPEIDTNEDGKLTIRELRDVSRRLTALDRNRDGGLSQDEIVPTIRVAIGHGPTVHRHLSTLRRRHPPSAQPAATPPEWFVRMDKNKDNDLTRSEFLGADDQFTALDADGDKLIDPTEATRANESALTPGP
jgi:hypothetical protein